MSYKITNCICTYLTYTLLNWKSNIGILKINPISCQNRIEKNINHSKITHTSSSCKKNISHAQQLSAGCLVGFLSGVLAKHIGKFAIILFIGIYLVSWTGSFRRFTKPWNMFLYFSQKIWHKKNKSIKEIANELLFKNIVFKSSFAATFGFGFLYS
ncbi:hypothetical protein PNEG_02882 [Pneumocystis murina B123]|uniref:FUN14 domain-containing protein n=1 Tax=Pneumocystis murina (strain B123) TaxID=1069680 RepID=M7PE10_PNEMU|nr:hypothetical protein PNEG_02882 [Pneumocystis murina B123]EMR08704.2 hypothetical protein PNEG_02882 [Pneumocystis murina B123]